MISYIHCMCGQFEALNKLKQMLADLRAVEAADEAPDAVMVVKPTLAAPVLVANPEHGSLEVAPMRFGLVPGWWRKSIRDFTATTFNARLEEVDTKPVFKGAWRYRRAVVPAEAFYEWSGPRNDRTKWRITRGDNQPLAFAAIWDEAPCAEGELFSFAILTRPAGPDMADIHDREPVILPRDAWADWVRMRRVDLRAPSPLRKVAMSERPAPAQGSLF